VPRGDRLAAVGLEQPHVRFVVERRADDPGGEAQARSHPVLVDAQLGVGLELVARRVDPCPVGPLLERELIAEGRNVDGDAGIGVPVPGSADTVARLHQQVVVEAGCGELDRRADPGEPRSHDHDLVIRHTDTHGIHIHRVSEA